MDPTTSIIPIFAIFMVFGAPILAILVWVWFRHQERMAMISQGLMPPDPRMTRKMGRQGFVPGPGWTYDPAAAANIQLRRGVSTSLIGMGLLIGLSFVGANNNGTFTLGPWLIPGFIVLFVGLANVANAYLAGGRFAGQQGANTYFAPGPQMQPPPQANQQPGPAPTVEPSAGPFGWRPGDLPEIGRGPGSIDQR